MRDFFLLILLSATVGSANDRFLYFDENRNQLAEPVQESVWLFGAVHGRAKSRAEKTYYRDIADLADRRKKTVLLEESVRPDQVALDPISVLRHAHETSTPSLLDVRALENWILKREWRHLAEGGSLDVGTLKETDVAQIEMFKLMIHFRSFFMGATVGGNYIREPNRPFLAAMGRTHLDDGILVEQLKAMKVPSTYIVREEPLTKRVLRSLEQWEKSGVKSSTRRRMIQDKFVNRLLDHAVTVANYPRRDQYFHAWFLDPEKEEKFFQMRRNAALEVHALCKECLCVLEKMGVR